MANHLRRQVREAVATLLTNLATTGTNVFQSRVLVLKDTQLPALIINTNEEEITQETIHDNPLLERRLSIAVIGKAKAVADIDDKLDQIAKEVEVAINANQAANTLNGLVHGITLDSIDVTISDETEKKVGEIRMGFTAIYFNQAATPDVST